MEKTKRELILESALDLFVSNGFEGSPTSKIAKNAGVATGTLFHYFKTKEDLINELYLAIKEQMLKHLKENLCEAKTIRQKLECIWINSVKWGLESSSANKFFKMFGTSSYIRDTTRLEGFKQFEFVLAIFHEGMELEILKNIPQELLIEITSGIISGTVNYFVQDKEKFKDKNLREKAFKMLWDSLKR